MYKRKRERRESNQKNYNIKISTFKQKILNRNVKKYMIEDQKIIKFNLTHVYQHKHIFFIPFFLYK